MDFGKKAAEKGLDLATKVTEVAIDHSPEIIRFLSGPKREGRQLYIEAVKADSNLNPYEKAALVYYTDKNIRKYSRLNKVVGKAIPFLSNHNTLNSIEPGWKDTFLDGAENIDNEDLQELWGRVLATEGNEPGSVPKSLIHALTVIDSTTAEYFALVRNFVIDIWEEEDLSDSPHTTLMLPLAYNSQLYEDMGVTYSALLDLEAAGLVKTVAPHPFSVYPKDKSKRSLIVKYFDKTIRVHFNDESGFTCSNATLTRSGEVLKRVLVPSENEKAFSLFCESLKAAGHKYDILT